MEIAAQAAKRQCVTYSAEQLTCVFNRIRDFEAQIHDIDPAMLRLAGTVFNKHGAHRHFGLTLLHRHEILDPGFVMVHTEAAAQEDICAIELYGTRHLYPVSFLVDAEHSTVPYEFSDKPQVPLGDAFFSDMASLLTTYGLTQLFGITSILPAQGIWIERQLADSSGTISAQEVVGDLGDLGVITAWQFVHDASGLTAKPMRKCVTAESGGHRVT